MSWWYVGTAVGGALLSNHQSNKALDAQEAAAGNASGWQRYVFDQQRADQMPWMDAGRGALSQLTAMSQEPDRTSYADLTSDPGYVFARDQGMAGIQGSAAAKGGLYSGQALKDLTSFNSGNANRFVDSAFNRQQSAIGNRWSRLASLAGIGQGATNQVGGAGARFGDNMSNLATGVGNAQGANAIQQGNVFGSLLGQFGSSMGRRYPGGSGGGGSFYRSDDPYRNPGYVGGMEGE